MAKVVQHDAGYRAVMTAGALRALLTGHAQNVLAAAKADPHDDTFAYENGLRIEQDTTDRIAVRVVSGDRKGHILEADFGILARALDSA